MSAPARPISGARQWAAAMDRLRVVAGADGCLAEAVWRVPDGALVARMWGPPDGARIDGFEIVAEPEEPEASGGQARGPGRFDPGAARGVISRVMASRMG